MKKVLIIGAGTMGSGIAVAFSIHDYKVALVDQTKEKALNSKARNINALKDLINKGYADSQWINKVEENIEYFKEDDLDSLLPDYQLVIESVFEDVEVKKNLYAKINPYLTKDCIVCSNTSALNVFEIADINYPENLVITHWFNPPYIMELVEIVKDDQTSDETVSKVKKILEEIDKKPAVINQYIPGFIANRLGAALMREASYMVSQGWTTPSDIDSAIALTCGIRYAFEGPMGLYDVVGWNIIQAGALAMYPTLCNDADGGNRLARSLIDRGELGVVSGKGVFDYSTVLPQEYLSERTEKIIKLQNFVNENILE